ncbi:hypothetical protein [Caballeronia sp. KNU42]
MIGARSVRRASPLPVACSTLARSADLSSLESIKPAEPLHFDPLASLIFPDD